MNSLVVVAIPAEDDPVWKVSTEKKPHITILFLGDSNNPNRDAIAQFMIHAANLSLTRFGLSVDRRGELGSDKADVVFFEDEFFEIEKLKEFRGQLLQNNLIKAAYDSAEQFPEWNPHLTLGYPAAPAKDNAIDYPIRYVDFDRIALWDGDSEGVELVLPRYRYPMEVSMSDISADAQTVVDDILTHHGVKGMKWGVRKAVDERTSSDVTIKTKKVTTPGKTKLKTTGGASRPAHKDAVNAATIKQVHKRSGSAALSNKELQELQTRLNLEANVSRLTYNEKSAAQKLIAKLVGDAGKSAAQPVQKAANDHMSKEVAKMMAKKGAKAAAVAAL